MHVIIKMDLIVVMNLAQILYKYLIKKSDYFTIIFTGNYTIFMALLYTNFICESLHNLENKSLIWTYNDFRLNMSSPRETLSSIHNAYIMRSLYWYHNSTMQARNY